MGQCATDQTTEAWVHLNPLGNRGIARPPHAQGIVMHAINHKIRRRPRALLVLLALLGVSVARADPFDFYAGAGLGSATVSVGTATGGVPPGFDPHDVGWKALVGLRPLSIIGAEVEYANLGRPSTTLAGLDTQASAHATSAFALVYAPLPLPILDIYGKVGMTRLSASVNGSASGALKTLCDVSPTTPGCHASLTTSTQTVAWGLGTQVKLASLAARVEYERFGNGSVTPGLVSVSLLWHF